MAESRKEKKEEDDDDKKYIIYADNILTSTPSQNPDSSSHDVEEKGSEFQVPYTQSPAEKKLLRKIGYTFLPIVTLIVMVQVRYYCSYLFVHYLSN